MKIHVQMSVPAARSWEIRSLWSKAGGAVDRIRDTGGGAILIDSKDADDDLRMRALAQRFDASYVTPLRLSRTASFEPAEIEAAELCRVIAPGARDVVDRRSLVTKRRCPQCGERLPIIPGPDGMRLEDPGALAGRFDLVADRGPWIMSCALAEALSFASGLELTPLTEAEGPSALFSQLSTKTRIGYPENKTVRGPACSQCRSRKELDAYHHPILDLGCYDRAHWSGDDFVSASTRGRWLFVSQAARKVLADPKWRYPGGPLTFSPVVWASSGTESLFSWPLQTG